MENLVRMTSWVSKSQKAKVKKAGKGSSGSLVIRNLIENNL